MQRAASFFPPLVQQLLPLPRTGKKVLIVGGGSAGLLAAERLRHLFDVTVVDPKPYFEFSPSVPRALVRPWVHHSKICFDYREILEQKLGIEFIQGWAEKIDINDNKGPASGRRGVLTIRDWYNPTDGKPGGPGLDPIPKPQDHNQEVFNSLKRQHIPFDYLVVSTGVSNGIWKQPFESYEERNRQLKSKFEQIKKAKEVHIVGAGLVGVEVAAEIIHYLHGKQKVSIYDGNPRLLFQLPSQAHEYSADWLKYRNCAIRLGQGFDFKKYGGDVDGLDSQSEANSTSDTNVNSDSGPSDSVITCVGVAPNNQFINSEFLDSRGFVKVNRSMQMVKKIEKPIANTGAAAGNSDSGATSNPSDSSSNSNEPLQFEEHTTVDGLYAVGDCVNLEGLPKTVYVAEEMSTICVQNIEREEGFESDLLTQTMEAGVTRVRIQTMEAGVTRSSDPPEFRQITEDMQFPFCVSLGPHDGLFAQQGSAGGQILLDGKSAALQKQLIEDTKMDAMTEKDYRMKLAWSLVH